jgi:cytochrome c553
MRTTGLQLALSAGLLAVVFPAATRADDSATRQIVEAKVHYCKDCHGQQGQGFRGAYPIPRLAGQNLAYLQAKADVILEHKRENVTADTFMAPVLASVDSKARTEVYDHFSKLNPPPAFPGPKELATAGKKIFEEGVAQDDVPPCAGCHGPEAKGNGEIPRLAGQIYPYAVKVLTNWSIINKERAREDGRVIKSAAHRLSPSQIEAVAAYVSNLN